MLHCKLCDAAFITTICTLYCFDVCNHCASDICDIVTRWRHGDHTSSSEEDDDGTSSDEDDSD